MQRRATISMHGVNFHIVILISDCLERFDGRRMSNKIETEFVIVDDKGIITSETSK